MSFSSLEFLLFFPIVLVVYNLIPPKLRLYFLLISSYFFYLYQNPLYVLLLIGVTLTTFFFAKWIGTTTKDKKAVLILGICLILLPLLFYKYFNFFNQILCTLLGNIGATFPQLTIDFLLPVGISFYTFMSIGYLIDVYYEDCPVEKNICSVALFLSFFPYLLSGPIERSNRMFPQIKNLQRSTPEDISNGLKIMLWGYFMKLCVADRIKPFVDVAIDNIDSCSGSVLVLTAVLYAIEIYADFGGYSMLALGTAKCFGINVSPNFRRPFFSSSVSELWHRWHISLITWLTDYVFKPISFSLKQIGWRGIAIAVITTFLLSGLWHGANWTFVIWGLINAIILCYEMIVRKYRMKVENRFRLSKNRFYLFLRCFLVFSIFSLCTIICRCNSINQVKEYFDGLLSHSWSLSQFVLYFNLFGIKKILFTLLSIAILFSKDIFDENNSVLEKDSTLEFICHLLIVVYILSTGVISGEQYIYFNF